MSFEFPASHQDPPTSIAKNSQLGLVTKRWRHPLDKLHPLER